MKLGDFPVLPGPASSLPAAWSRLERAGLGEECGFFRVNLSRLLSGGPGGAPGSFGCAGLTALVGPWESTARAHFASLSHSI